MGVFLDSEVSGRLILPQKIPFFWKSDETFFLGINYFGGQTAIIKRVRLGVNLTLWLYQYSS